VVAPNVEKLVESCVMLFGLVWRRLTEGPISRVELIKGV